MAARLVEEDEIFKEADSVMKRMSSDPAMRDAAFVSLLGVFASPTAVNSFTMAQQMGGDAELAGDTVVVTSAVSMATMFLWVFLFKSLGMF